MKKNMTTRREICLGTSMICHDYPNQGMKSGKYLITTMNRQIFKISCLVLLEKYIWLKFQKSLLLDVISFFKGVVIVLIRHSPLLTLNLRLITFLRGSHREIAKQLFLTSAEAK